VSSENPYKIPIVDLATQYVKIRDEVRKAIDEVVDSQQFILGRAVKRFEDQMAHYLRCGFAVGVASGSDALLLGLMALGVGPGDGVIVTPFTFFSTVSSITRLGAVPLFVEIAMVKQLIPRPAYESKRCCRFIYSVSAAPWTISWRLLRNTHVKLSKTSPKPAGRGCASAERHYLPELSVTSAASLFSRAKRSAVSVTVV
jgi:DegT/DnrJ/EryC1/StrS aminotransferase family